MLGYKAGWLDVIVTVAVAAVAILGIGAFFMLPAMQIDTRWIYETGLSYAPLGVIEHIANIRPDLVALGFGLAPVPLWLVVNAALRSGEEDQRARRGFLLAMLGCALLSLVALASIISWFSALPDVPEILLWPVAGILAVLIVGAAYFALSSASRLSEGV
jgi:hypothetical protein